MTLSADVIGRDALVGVVTSGVSLLASKTHTHTHRQTKSEPKVQPGLGYMSDKGSKQENSLRSKLDRNLKLARAQCDKDLANMRVAQRN